MLIYWLNWNPLSFWSHSFMLMDLICWWTTIIITTSTNIYNQYNLTNDNNEY